MALDPIAQTTCAVPYALKAVRGDSIDIRLRLINAATGRPIVLTGWSGAANIYDTPLAGAIKHTLTVVVDQAAAAQPTTGIVTITAAPNETVGWTEFGYWALVLTDGTASKTIIAGPWSLAGTSISEPGFTCGIGGASGACGAQVFDLIGAQCEVLTSGYTEVVLPYPQAQCAC